MPFLVVQLYWITESFNNQILQKKKHWNGNDFSLTIKKEVLNKMIESPSMNFY